jgi:glycosyltransferase involved in cell wall biosynthesis
VPAPLLLDLSHTSHTTARTGIQRVVRSLRTALSRRAEAVTYDPYQGQWRPLEAWEEQNLASPSPSTGRGARWPLVARIRGRLRRARGSVPALAASGTPPGEQAAGVLVPEIFSPAVSAALPRLFGATRGSRVALFHDAIALRYPEFTPQSNVARFPGYLRDLLMFDGIAAVSQDSRTCLIDYWRWLGVPSAPEVAVIALGIDTPPAGAAPSAERDPPLLLSVGSIEGRKNHAALLEACESLWSRGLRFELRLVGLANAETGGTALARLERLRAAGRPVRHDGPVGDAALEEAYRECAFTVYPSLAEGFGLPVAESLARGKPCLCRTAGALGEVALGGGCVSLGSGGAAEIAPAIEGLLASPETLAKLRREAASRRFRSWSEYATDLLAWMASLRRKELEKSGMR